MPKMLAPTTSLLLETGQILGSNFQEGTNMTFCHPSVLANKKNLIEANCQFFTIFLIFSQISGQFHSTSSRANFKDKALKFEDCFIEFDCQNVSMLRIIYSLDWSFPCLEKPTLCYKKRRLLASFRHIAIQSGSSYHARVHK